MRFMPIGRPISPRPISPIFFVPTEDSKGRLLEIGGRKARLHFAQKEDTIVAELLHGSSAARPSRPTVLNSSALRKYKSDVVALFVGTELPDFIDNGRNQRIWRHFTVPSQCFDQALFPELFSCIVERLGYAVSIECERISRKEQAFPDRAIPFFEESKQGARGIESFKSIVVPEEKGREVSTICVAQAPRLFIIFRKE